MAGAPGGAGGVALIGRATTLGKLDHGSLIFRGRHLATSALQRWSIAGGSIMGQGGAGGLSKVRGRPASPPCKPRVWEAPKLLWTALSTIPLLVGSTIASLHPPLPPAPPLTPPGSPECLLQQPSLPKRRPWTASLWGAGPQVGSRCLHKQPCSRGGGRRLQLVGGCSWWAAGCGSRCWLPELLSPPVPQCFPHQGAACVDHSPAFYRSTTVKPLCPAAVARPRVGLSAALILGRARRRVAIFDSGEKRNEASIIQHAILGADGFHRQEFLDQAREQVRCAALPCAVRPCPVGHPYSAQPCCSCLELSFAPALHSICTASQLRSAGLSLPPRRGPADGACAQVLRYPTVSFFDLAVTDINIEAARTEACSPGEIEAGTCHTKLKSGVRTLLLPALWLAAGRDVGVQLWDGPATSFNPLQPRSMTAGQYCQLCSLCLLLHHCRLCTEGSFLMRPSSSPLPLPPAGAHHQDRRV